ncbi:Putative NAD(P)H nitroreductase [BD1-7 clade bacterium]|uniref:NAD(P)H nitroreductase n=1 Tax=BD1-7 clade bacterium TaxID=2029982 RepID=A0A5S9PK47_9GAMM|nr:Putative NAD(P)H nitroreductase [BD1-7 clade bacterium]CAA0104593.1 Putative NAD(P)H nitroreductase [BD1-7 clade bacterium]
MTLIDALNWRYAVKTFSERIVSTETRNELIEAVRLTPSCYGLQPYRLIRVTAEDTRQRLVDHAWGQNKVLDSSDLFVFAVHTDGISAIVDRYLQCQSNIRGESLNSLNDFRQYLITTLGQKDNAEVIQWAHRQAYIALGQLTTAAAIQGVDTCPMEGINTAGFDRVLGLESAHLTTSVACVIGYRDAEDSQASVPKVRFPTADFLVEM